MSKSVSITTFCLLVVLACPGQSNQAQVVTNPPPAVTATMQLAGNDGEVFTWNVQGKVKPAYRGHGATVKLACTRYSNLLQGGNSWLVFPASSDPNDTLATSNVDACGNFTFSIVSPVAQLDPSYVCVFVVHVDDSKTPQACSGKSVTPDAVPDPNGSAPCSGGFCPVAP